MFYKNAIAVYVFYESKFACFTAKINDAHSINLKIEYLHLHTKTQLPMIHIIIHISSFF